MPAAAAISLAGGISVAILQAAYSGNRVIARWNFQATKANRLGKDLVVARAEQSTLDDWSTGGQFVNADWFQTVSAYPKESNKIRQLNRSVFHKWPL